MFRVCFCVDRYVCATADRDIIPVRVVKKNVRHSVARSHPHSIFFGSVFEFEAPYFRRHYFLVQCNPTEGKVCDVLQIGASFLACVSRDVMTCVPQG